MFTDTVYTWVYKHVYLLPFIDIMDKLSHLMVKNQAAEERVIPSPLSLNVFELPARSPSDSFLYNSVTSLNSHDNILVNPPTMFDSDGKGERDDTGSELRRNNEQTNSPNSTEHSVKCNAYRKQGTLCHTFLNVITQCLFVDGCC